MAFFTVYAAFFFELYKSHANLLLSIIHNAIMALL